MTSLQLSFMCINSHQEILPNLMREQEGEAIREMLSWYSPNGPIRYSTIHNGGAGISQSVVINSNHWDTDQVMRQLIGLPSLNLALNSSVTAGGKGFALPSSFLADLGESVERISGTFAFLKEDLGVCTGSYNSLQHAGQNAIAPEVLPLFADEQYVSPDFFFHPFTHDTDLTGSRGADSLAKKTSGFLCSLLFSFISHPSKRPESAIRLLLVWPLIWMKP